MRHPLAKMAQFFLAIALVAVFYGFASAEPVKAPAKPPEKPAAADKPPVKPAAAPPAKPAAKPTPKPAAAAADDEPGANDPVEKAIRRAVDYLYKTQKGDNWEVSPRRNGDGPADVAGAQWGGLTSMATYALLAAGESPQNPQVAKAIEFLDKAEVVGTYAMAMKLQIWNYIERPTAPQKDVLRRDATLLLSGVNASGPSAGLYHYKTTADGTYDSSCSNYGVLGMWAAAQQNLEVPTAYWELVDKAWRKTQEKDGGWSYTRAGERGSTISMTGAGVATLFITQDMLGEGKGGECKGNVDDKDLERGLKWLSEHYGTLGNNLYAMYNIERVGTASGYKYFGTVDWYKTGAAHLIKSQKPDGSWEGGHGTGVPGTVWGILFLVKGRAPVMMNKLEYGIDLHGDKGTTNWNQRPRDIANLAHWTGKQLEKDLNWQIVNLKVDIDDLHDAPILYIAGNQNISFTKEEKAKLKQYVEQGGMILGHADCNDSKFSTAFAKLGQELFPAYEFRELPPEHLIYTAHFNGKNWTNKPVLRGLSNGAREMMVLIPSGDPARYWQIRNFSSGQTKPLAELASNIYLYALDKSTLKSKFKGQTYIVKRNESVKPTKAVKVARLEYGGSWDPEPGGWRRFANLMHNTRGVELTVMPVKLGEGKLSKEFAIAHLTGSGRFKLSDAQQKELKDFVDGGGTLVMDAAGGAVEFKESAETSLNAAFGAAAQKLNAPLPVDHAIYKIGGDNLARASYRPYAKRLLAGGMNAPRLRGIEINNRTAVIYSPEDLSVGLVGMSVDGIYGYEPDYANRLMESIVLYAMGGTAPAKVAAGPKPEATDLLPPDDGEMKKPMDKKPEDKKVEEKKPEAPPKDEVKKVMKK
jgi:hypothetical protein